MAGSVTAEAGAGTIVEPAAGPGERRYFTMLPNVVIENPALTPADFRLYAYYARVCGQTGAACYKSARSIAADTGISERQQQTSRAHLAALGLVVVVERDGFPVTVRLVDVWDENARHALARAPRPAAVGSAATAEGGRQSLPRGSAAIAEGGRQSLPTKKIPIRRSPEEEEITRDALIEQLLAVGMESYQADGLLEFLDARGYRGADLAWVLRQGLDRRAKSPEYYREIAESNPPGVVERKEAARVARRRAASGAPPPPRGASHDGMPHTPPPPGGGAS